MNWTKRVKAWGCLNRTKQVRCERSLSILGSCSWVRVRRSTRSTGALVCINTNASAVPDCHGENGAKLECEALYLINLCSKPNTWLWLGTEKMRLTHFGGKVFGSSLEEHRHLWVEPLLLRVERSQLRSLRCWSGFLLIAASSRGRPRKRWRDHIAHLGKPWDSLEEAGECDWKEGRLSSIQNGCMDELFYLNLARTLSSLRVVTVVSVFCVCLSTWSYSRSTNRRDTKRTSDVFICSFVSSLSLSLHVFLCLSLNILFQEGWPTWDKQKEEDLLSSFSNSPFTLSRSFSFSFSLSSSISLSLSHSIPLYLSHS